MHATQGFNIAGDELWQFEAAGMRERCGGGCGKTAGPREAVSEHLRGPWSIGAQPEPFSAGCRSGGVAGIESDSLARGDFEEDCCRRCNLGNDRRASNAVPTDIFGEPWGGGNGRPWLGTCQSGEKWAQGVHEKICGPDVTDLVIEQYQSIAFDPGWPKLLDVTPHVSAIDFKNIKPVIDRPPAKCPSNCGEFITFCGQCTHDQVPGNIGLGVAYSLEVALAIGELAAWIGGSKESEEDKKSYKFGQEVKRIMNPYVSFPAPIGPGAWPAPTWKDGAHDAIKKELCAAFTKFQFTDFGKTQNCELCPHAYK